MSSNYKLIEAEKTFCPKCELTVDLLQPIHIQQYLPAFYICFGCKTVGEVAAGPVARV